MSSKSSIHGKVAIITGASSGIGQGIAVDFAKQGCRLALCGRNQENLEKTKSLCIEQGLTAESILLIQADMMKNDDVKKILDETLEHFDKQLDILINNAGIGKPGVVDTMSMEDYYKTMQVNVHSVVYLTHLAVPYLEKTKGCIVTTSSVFGTRPIAGFLIYSMTKAAIDQFMRCCALDLAPRGIRVNNVNPGVIDTPIFLRDSLMTTPEYEAFKEYSRSTHPMCRIGAVEEVSSVVSFLVSSKAAYTTGATIQIDGGRHSANFSTPPPS